MMNPADSVPEEEIVIPGMAAFPQLSGLLLGFANASFVFFICLKYFETGREKLFVPGILEAILFTNLFLLFVFFVLLKPNYWVFRRNEVLYCARDTSKVRERYDIEGYHIKYLRFGIKFTAPENGFVYKHPVRFFWIGRKYHKQLKTVYNKKYLLK